MKLLNIQEAAEIVGVHVDTLRSWEEKGVLKPTRTIGGHRRYKMEDIENLMGQVSPILSLAERQILAYQCSILENQADSIEDDLSVRYWRQKYEAYMNGYEGEYFESNLNKETLSKDECSEVSEIIDMYWNIQRINDSFENDVKIDNHHVTFPGFDDSRQAGYAYHICRNNAEKIYNNIMSLYTGFDSYNYIQDSLQKYRHMLTLWKSLRKKDISVNDLKSIISVYYPSVVEKE